MRLIKKANRLQGRMIFRAKQVIHYVCEEIVCEKVTHHFCPEIRRCKKPTAVVDIISISFDGFIVN